MKVYINKQDDQNVGGVSNMEWQDAIKAMTASEFALYMFLSNNQDGSIVELTKEIYRVATGYQKTSYYDAIKKLMRLRYLIKRCDNELDFFTAPVPDDGTPPKRTHEIFGEMF